MEKREIALVEIYDRIKAARDSLGLEGCLRTPTRPIGEYGLPCVFMDEGIDEIVTTSGRNPAGYPGRRQLEVILEIAANKKNHNIKQLYRDVRTAVLTGGVRVADDISFREIRTEGPTGYGLPDVIGMRLVLALFYPDDGT